MNDNKPRTASRVTDLADSSTGNVRAMLISPRPWAYIVLILLVVAGAFLYNIRMNGIFACQAAGYGSDRYAAYCQATKYGDYDHGAFWFDLEPGAIVAAKNADVLFLGNSRMQFGFSSEAVLDWFSARAVRHYLLGFSHDGNFNFAGPLLSKLEPKAKLYVLNVDLFFEQYISPPVRTINTDPGAKSRYNQKRGWQSVHKALCGRFPSLCGNEIAFFRSRATGDWLVQREQFESAPVTYDDQIDPRVVDSYASAGARFLSELPVDRDCVILTIVPKPGTGIATVKAVADALEVSLIAPQVGGLMTFDGSHLDEPSRERWSAAFIEAAGPQIRACLDKSGAPPS